MNIEIKNGLTITEISIWPVRDAQALRIKAMANITFNDALRVNGCRIIEGAKGPFVSYPSEKKPESENWISYAHPVTRDASDKIQDAVIEHWKACTTPEQRGLSDGS
jgi:stage V sporulation protein G